MNLRRALSASFIALFGAAVAYSGGSARAATPNVLRVGTWNGVSGTYPTIQAAVDAAQPGDFILVGPGDWHERGGNDPAHPAGVLVEKPSIHLRGMDRNGVIVDGTNANAAVPCDPDPAVQEDGPVIPGTSPAKHAGRNGIEVFGKGFTADGVSIENLTVCNFLSNGDGNNGNEIWWNGGDGSGQIGMRALLGSYLTASSSYDYATDASNKDGHQGKYGIFASNEQGPGVIDHTYASNMGDSAYYVGACHGDCNMVLDNAHAQNSALGFSGTNSGGRMIIANSEFDDNLAGIGPNTLNNDDAPSPSDGICPNGGTGPTGTHSCSVIVHNSVHDNNNPNTPSTGIAGSVPVGTGILLSGVRDWTVVGNRIENNGSWGVLVNDFPDTSQPPPVAHCEGGVDLSTPASPLCYFFAYGNEVTRNAFAHNGGFGGLGDGDIGQATALAPGKAGNCYHGDTDPTSPVGVTTDPPGLEALGSAACGVPASLPGGLTLLQLFCASGSAIGLPSCPNVPGVINLPARTTTTFLPIPHNLPTMPDPCAGIPANPWCPARSATGGQGESGAPGLVSVVAERRCDAREAPLLRAAPLPRRCA